MDPLLFFWVRIPSHRKNPPSSTILSLGPTREHLGDSTRTSLTTSTSSFYRLLLHFCLKPTIPSPLTTSREDCQGRDVTGRGRHSHRGVQTVSQVERQTVPNLTSRLVPHFGNSKHGWLNQNSEYETTRRSETLTWIRDPPEVKKWPRNRDDTTVGWGKRSGPTKEIWDRSRSRIIISALYPNPSIYELKLMTGIEYDRPSKIRSTNWKDSES